MVIKNTTQVGDPVIRRRSAAVKIIKSAAVKKIVTNLTDSMRHHELVGMAAPQIGVNLRIFVTEVRKTKTRIQKETDPLRVFINPKIVKFSKRVVAGYEGCGSVANAGLFGAVKRPAEVVVTAFDQEGKRFKLYGKGLLARIIQHETDHLNGIVFLDRVSDTKSLISREEYIKRK